MARIRPKRKTTREKRKEQKKQTKYEYRMNPDNPSKITKVPIQKPKTPKALTDKQRIANLEQQVAYLMKKNNTPERR